eukprot:scaffold60565_cov57-Phaeocystis_antarctica.AAC.1
MQRASDNLMSRMGITTPAAYPSPPSPPPFVDPIAVNPLECDRTYSSVYDFDACGTGNARSKLDSPQAWSARTYCPERVVCQDKRKWMQINAGSNVPVYGIRVQGRANCNNCQYVTSVYVQHSADGSTWIYVDRGATFTAEGRATFMRGGLFGMSGSFGNFDARFIPPVMAQYIRITVVKWIGHISMRAGLLVDPIA